MEHPEALPTLPSRKVLFTLVGFFFLLTFAVYGPSLRNGFALLDDGLLIYENNALKEISLEHLKAIFTSYDPELYIPLTFVHYQLDYLIGGYNPFVYHLTNLLLHTFNALLVTWLAYVILSPSTMLGVHSVEGWRGRTKSKLFAALIAGTLFATHPLHVETVAWAAARKDLLSTFFFLSSLLTYLYHLPRFQVSGFRFQTTMLLYAASVVLFLLGLFSKVTVLTLPFILLLCEWWLRDTHSTSNSASTSVRAPTLTPVLLRVLPYFLFSLLFGLIALGGKRELVTSLTIVETLLLASKSITLSLGKIFLPINLSLFYPQLTPITISNAEFLIPALVVATLLLTAILCFSSTTSRLTKDRAHQYTSILVSLSNRLPGTREAHGAFAFGAFFFLITLAPSLFTFAKGGENVFVTSDRYAYVPSIGILFAVGAFLLQWCTSATRIEVLRQRRLGAFAVLPFIALIFSTLTIRQSLLWGNHVALFEHVTRLSPNFYLSHIHLGVGYRLAGKLDKAEDAFKEALRLRPLGNTHGALAQVYAQQKKFGEAIAEFEKGIAIDPSDYELHHGLGQVYALQGRFDDALREFERALALMPPPETQYLKLARRAGARRDVVLERIGILHGERGEHERAIEYYEQALQENPFLADAHYNLGVALGNLGKEEEAIRHYEEAVQLEPAHTKARVNLALLLAQRGSKLRAITLLQEVLKEDPTNTIAKEALQRL